MYTQYITLLHVVLACDLKKNPVCNISVRMTLKTANNMLRGKVLSSIALLLRLLFHMDLIDMLTNTVNYFITDDGDDEDADNSDSSESDADSLYSAYNWDSAPTETFDSDDSRVFRDFASDATQTWNESDSDFDLF